MLNPIYIYIYIYGWVGFYGILTIVGYLLVNPVNTHILNWTIGLMSREFANGSRDRGSIPGRVIPKTQKMVLDAALLNTQHYKVRNKGKV